MLRKISFFICLIIASTTQAQNKSLPASKPKLVVGIVVDQMRADYISKYRNKLGTGGFKKLAAQGYQCRNTHYNYVPTYTGPGHASIYTGTTPAFHGIVANDWFDRTENDTVYCAEDKNVKGVGSDNYAGKMSPKRLLSTTITDELQLTNQGKSKVIGISLKDRGAILPAGRSGDAAYWYDGSTGNWISSTWYMNDLPKWVKDFNERKWPDHYLSKPWTTTLPLSYYTESDPDDSPYELPYTGEAKPVFPHDLPALRGTSFDLVRRTPFGNTMTKDLAIAAISGEELGADSITDFLCVSFSATDYVGHQFGTDA
ncbi:MAG TPA: alkaline phosphatase family protein, partial [Bacteroidia bacterium]|nr:alkaline phosphatase family protein [Bacteroidia bacterium]